MYIYMYRQKGVHTYEFRGTVDNHMGFGILDVGLMGLCASERRASIEG